MHRATEAQFSSKLACIVERTCGLADIVMVEFLEVFTSSVDFQGDDGQMSLTSKPQEAPDNVHSK